MNIDANFLNNHDFDPSRIAISNPAELKEKLILLAERVNDRIPVGYTVEIVRAGTRSFLFNIKSVKNNIVVQQFGINIDENAQVRWAAVV